MKIVVDSLTTYRWEIDCSPANSVETLKERICDISGFRDNFDLIYLGKRLKDDFLLGHCIIDNNAVLYVVPRVLYPGG